MSAYRRQRAKRRRRSLLVLTLILLAAGGFVLRAPLQKLLSAVPASQSEGPADPTAAAEFSLSPTLRLSVSATNTPGFEASRSARLLTKSKGGWVEQARVTLPNLPGEEVSITPLGGTYVIEARQANGLRRAELHLSEGSLTLLDYYSRHAPTPTVKTGSLLYVDKHLNQLWHFQDGRLIATYPVATGRHTTGPTPTMQDYMTNFFTPEGFYTIANKRIDPVYYGSAEHPPAAGGAPDNPLGPRWLGFSVLVGDGGNIWAIHGTNEPERIGTWVSDGCIRMRPADVKQLFERVTVETQLQIVSGRT